MRYIFTFGMLLALGLTVGCGGGAEIKPDASKTPQVDQAEVQKQIDEGMKQGGGAYQKYGKPPSVK